MSAIKRDGAFNAFVSQAQAIMGADLSEDWLFEIWQGADADPNRALNHVLDTPEDKMKRGGGGKASRNEPKTPKKSSSRPRESKPAPATPATTWDDDDYQTAPTPPPQQHYAQPGPPPPQQQPQYQQPPQSMHHQPQGMGYPQPQPMPYPSMYPGMPQPMMPPMSQPMMPPMSQPMMAQAPPTIPQFVVDPVTGLPMAPMNPIQQAQAMFVQQQQQQRLMMLKYSIDSVLTNPAMLTNPQIMQNLQDTMIQALEAPNATLQLAERARQSQQTAHFIQIMQGQVGQMLADPKVATNPALLQQLNNQMNQLRMLTMQHIAQQQLDSNPATALSLSMPVLAPPTVSATLLSRAMLNPLSGLVIPEDSTTAGVDENTNQNGVNGDWWMDDNTPKKSNNLGEKNPFRDETETCGGTPRRSVSRRSLSNPNLNLMGNGGLMGLNSLGSQQLGLMNPMLSGGNLMHNNPMMGGMMMQPHQSMPSLGAMYGANQPGYNPLLSSQQPFMSHPNLMGGQMYRPM